MAYSFRELKRDLSHRNTPVQRWVEGKLWQMRNARARAASAPDPADLQVVFAIPLISKERADDWDKVQRTLATTLETLRRQSDPRWTAIVSCQDRPERIDFDDRVRFLEFPHRPKGYDNHAKRAHIRDWLAQRRPPAAGYYFALDADDLLHPGLVAHILTDDNRAGYLIDRGYMLDHATLSLAALQPPDAARPEATQFHRSCGSSSAIYFDFASGADYATVLWARGNHRKVVRNMAYLGIEIALIPFPAAIYVMNHGDNLRQKRGRIAGKMKHFDLNPVSDPAEIARIGETFGFAQLFPGRWPAADPHHPG